MKNKFWVLTKKTKAFGYSYEVKNKLRYIKGSVIAILLGLVAAMVIVGILNVNPFAYLGRLIGIAFNGLYINQTMQWISVYVVAGLAIAVAFKSGSFNIGVAGQMMLGSALSIIFVKLNNIEVLNFGYTLVILLITIFSGAFVAGLAGLLKAFFNIHEVVSTIMLNWTIWYLFKFIFTKYSTTLGGEGIATSGSIPSGALAIGSDTILIPLLLMLITLIIVAFIFGRTVFGFEIKAVGVSPDASKYAGYNVKWKIIEAMLFSGALAGLASFINITTINPNISFVVDSLPMIGYDAIAISLVAYNNPIGIFFTSILWGIIKSSGTSAAALFGIPTQFSALIFGVIVYFAAISVVFMKYAPIVRLKLNLAVLRSKKNQNKLKELKRQQKALRFRLVKMNQEKAVINYKQEINIAKNQAVADYERGPMTSNDKKNLNKTLSTLKKNLKVFIKDYRQNIDNELSRVNLAIELLMKETYIKEINSAKKGIERRHTEFVRQTEEEAVKEIVDLQMVRLENNDLRKQAYSNQVNQFKIAKKEAKAVLDKTLKANSYWYEGAYGELTNYFSMVNTKKENLGEIKKHQIILENEISSLKTEYRLDRVSDKLKNNPKKLSAKKRELKKTIRHLKTNFKKFEKTKRAEIDKETKLYHQSVQELKKTDDLQKLKEEFAQKNVLAKLEYDKTIQEIDQAKTKFEAKYDQQRSECEFVKAQKLFKDFESQNRRLSNKQDRLNQQLTEFYKLQKNINKIYKKSFASYDSKKFMKKKLRLYKKLNAWEENLETQLIVLTTDEILDEAKKKHRQLIKSYDQKVKAINQEYKFQVKAIKNDPSLRHYEREDQLVAQEEFYNLELDNLIYKLENQVLLDGIEVS